MVRLDSCCCCCCCGGGGTGGFDADADAYTRVCSCQLDQSGAYPTATTPLPLVGEAGRPGEWKMKMKMTTKRDERLDGLEGLYRRIRRVGQICDRYPWRILDERTHLSWSDPSFNHRAHTSPVYTVSPVLGTCICIPDTRTCSSRDLVDASS